MFPTTWLSPEFTAMITDLTIVVLGVTQTVKKVVEKFLKTTVKPFIAIAISIVVSLIVCFSHLASDGLIGYLIIVAATVLAANGIFKIARPSGG